MQRQEHDYQEPTAYVSHEPWMNTDPREQPRSAPPQEPGERTYEDGYMGSTEGTSWQRGGEKLHARPQNERRNTSLLTLGVVACIVLLAAGLLGLLVIWLSVVFAFLLIAVVVVLIINSKQVITSAMPPANFQVIEHPRLELRNDSGAVVVRRGEEGVIRVAAIKHSRGIDSRHTPVQYNQAGNTLKISCESAWSSPVFRFLRVDFEITVPANCDLQLSNDSGNISVQGIDGTIRLTTDHGEIDAYDLRGPITLKTDSGTITARNLQGELRLTTDHGNVLASGLRGSARCKTDHGNISIEQSVLSGSSRLATDGGTIAFAGVLDPAGDYEMRTDHGNIAVTLPPDASFSLDAKVDQGLITSDFPQVVQGTRKTVGTVGAGPTYPRLRLRTDHGEISIVRGLPDLAR